MTRIDEQAFELTAPSGRRIDGLLRYRAAGPPGPRIVFSHGYGGDETNFAEISTAWAELGCVVFHPRHEDSLLGVDATGRRKIISRILEELERIDLWRSRIEDLRSVLAADWNDVVPESTQDDPAVGLSGHSLGAFTALLASGLTSDRLTAHELAELHIPARGLVLFSPQGPGQQGIHDGSFDEIRTPLMTITGTLDRSLRGEDPSWRGIPYDKAASRPKYHAVFEGAGHHSFGGFDPARPEVTGHLAEAGFTGAVQRLTRSFWQRCLLSRHDRRPEHLDHPAFVKLQCETERP